MSDTIQPGTAQVMARALAQSQSASTEVSDGCWVCQQQLWISLFFDEPGHDAEKERGTERLSNIGKLLYAHSNDEDKGLYRRYYNGLGVAFKPGHAVRSQTAQEVAQKQVEDTLKDKAKDAVLERDWKGLRNPRNWGPDLLGLVAKVGVEAWDSLRDKPVVSQLTLSGVSTRINTALSELEQIVNSQSVPVTTVHVAVFGSGLGGAMARLFTNRLQEKCKQQGGGLRLPTAKGAVGLKIRFVGLLDCVSAQLDDNVLVGWTAGKVSLGMATLRVDGPMGLSRHVQQAVHLVAGHEQRVTHRLDSLRKAKCPYQETVWPGTHQDLVGGLAHQTQGRSHELARVPLVELYYAAYGAGLPMLSMSKLEKTDFKLYNDFQFTHKNAQGAGARSLTRQYGQSDGPLEDQLTWHMARYVAWLRLRLTTPEHPQRPGKAVYDMVDEQLRGLERTARHPRTQPSQLPNAQVRSLLRAYQQPLALTPAQIALFDYFVHDSLAGSAMDQAALDAGNNGYFKVRGIDTSDELPDALAEQATAPTQDTDAQATALA